MADVDKIIDKLNKEMGSSVIVRANKAYGIGHRRLSTGVLGIDVICGGNSPVEWGVPTGRITELWGEEGSGKTTVALNVIKSAQAQGFCGAFINVEGAWDNSWASKIGVDLGKLVIARVASAEDAEAVLYELITTPDVGVIVMDSLAMVTSVSELETDTRKKNIQPGSQPRAVNRIVRHIASAFNRWPIDDPNSVDRQPAVIFLNQVREKIGMMFGDPRYSPGGKGKDHQASIRIQMSKGQYLRPSKEEKKSAYGLILKARTVKNKVWPPQQAVEATLYIKNVKKFGVEHSMGSIDEADQLFMLGMHYGLIEQRGSQYEYEEVVAKGADRFKAELSQADAEYGQLREDILEQAWNRGGL